MDQSIKAGIIGVILAVFADFSVPPKYTPPPLDFLPTFVVAVFVIFIFRLVTVKDGLLTAFVTYFFSQTIVDTTELAYFYAKNEAYSFTVTQSILVNPVITAASAVIATYVGVWLAKKRTPPPRKTQPESTDIPPELQTV